MLFSMLNHLRNIGCVLVLVMFFFACEEQHEHTAPAIHARDSVPVMVSYGVNTLVSDSGVAKYRIVTEEWEVNTNLRPSRWIFNKGVFLEQFDEKFHVQAYIQCGFILLIKRNMRLVTWAMLLMRAYIIINFYR